ncbi:MAG: hypothetical protein WC889_16130, partial [Myxococcota bacterium]
MEILLLLRPKLIGAKLERIFRNSRGRGGAAFFLLLGTAFGAGIFLLAKWLLLQCLSLDLIGELVTHKLLSIAFMSFFFILVFSNVVSSLSTFFLADDLPLVISSPVRFESVFWARFLETIFHSSWAVFLFFLPVMIAYGVVFRSGPFYYLTAIVSTMVFLLTPAAIGVLITAVLVWLFPAHRLRELLLVIGVAVFVALYLLVRLMEPEQFLNPEGFLSMAEFVAAFNAPEFILLPSYWTVEIIFPALKHMVAPPIFIISLYATALGLSLAVSLVVGALYRDAFSKARQGRKVTFSRSWLVNLIVGTVAWPFPALQRAVLIKDFKVFLRQPSQWSQL